MKKKKEQQQQQKPRAIFILDGNNGRFYSIQIFCQPGPEIENKNIRHLCACMRLLSNYLAYESFILFIDRFQLDDIKRTSHSFYTIKNQTSNRTVIIHYVLVLLVLFCIRYISISFHVSTLLFAWSNVIS